MSNQPNRNFPDIPTIEDFSADLRVGDSVYTLTLNYCRDASPWLSRYMLRNGEPCAEGCIDTEICAMLGINEPEELEGSEADLWFTDRLQEFLDTELARLGIKIPR